MSYDLHGYSTSVVSDALDMLGGNGGCEGLRPLATGMSIFGPVYTLQFEDAGGKPAPAADYIDDVPAGSVVLVANSGRTDCTVWGDLLTLTAVRRGLAGTLIDGCCRDAGAIMQLDYPVFSKSVYMKSGKNRVRLVARESRVQFAGQDVRPGDFVRADDSGVIVIPGGKLAEIAQLCARIEAMESRVEADVRAGVRLAEARMRHGYNQFALPLQQGAANEAATRATGSAGAGTE